MKTTTAPEGYATPIKFTEVSIPIEGSRNWEYTRTDLVKGDLVRVGTGTVDWEVTQDPQDGGSVFLTRLTGKASPYNMSKTVQFHAVETLTRSFSIRAHVAANPAPRETGAAPATITATFPEAVQGKQDNFPPTSLSKLSFTGVDGHLTGIVTIGDTDLAFSNYDRKYDSALLYKLEGAESFWRHGDISPYLPEGVDAEAFQDYLAAAVDAVEAAANVARDSLLAVMGERLAAAAL